MNIRPLHRAIVLALSAPIALAACGGGGASVRPNPPQIPVQMTIPPPPAPPPPPTIAAGFGTVIVDVPKEAIDYSRGTSWTLGGLSGGTLIKRGHPLALQGANTFSGSVEIESGWLQLKNGAIDGNVNIRTGPSRNFESAFSIAEGAVVNGNVTSEPETRLDNCGTVKGNVAIGSAAAFSTNCSGAVIEGNVTLGTGATGNSYGGVIDGNLSLAANAWFNAFGGRVTGDVDIAKGAQFRLDTTVGGNVTNEGTLWAHGAGCEYDDPGYCGYYDDWFDGDALIGGDYVQTADGTLKLSLGADLHIVGRASLAGTLELYDPGYARATYGSTYLPAGNSDLLLHADGGIAGTFATFKPLKTVEGPLLLGTLEYGAKEVVFKFTQLSAASVMGTGADPMTLGGAGLLDRAFASANRLAGLPGASLSATQRNFLDSAGSLQWIGNLAQLRSSLDSISGQTHASGQSQLLAQLTSAPLRGVGERLAMPDSAAKGYWRSDGNAPYRQGTASLSGYDLALSPQWMVGGGVSFDDGRTQSSREGARSFGPSSGAQLYARWRNDSGGYVAGLLGVSGLRLQTERRIDLGDGELHRARSQRDLALVNLHLEAGRPFAFGSGRLTPFMAMDGASLQGDGFAEQGDTGFELRVRPTRTSQASATLGARYARDWNIDNRWLRLAFDGGYRRAVAGNDAFLRAAFTGAPEALFDIHDAGLRDGHGWFGLGLSGGRERWSWRLDHFHDSGIARGRQWSLGMKRTW